jgi:hypothetical protein
MFMSTLKLYNKTLKFDNSMAFLNGAAETAIRAQIAVMFVLQPVALNTETER